MNLSVALIARSAAAPVAALAGDRVTWIRRAQAGMLPAAVLTLISQVRSAHLGGADDMIVSRVQIDCYAMRHDQALTLAAAMRAALIGPAEVGGVMFWRGEQNGLRDLGEDIDGVGFVHRASLDLILRHTDDT